MEYVSADYILQSSIEYSMKYASDEYESVISAQTSRHSCESRNPSSSSSSSPFLHKQESNQTNSSYKFRHSYRFRHSCEGRNPFICSPSVIPAKAGIYPFLLGCEKDNPGHFCTGRNPIKPIHPINSVIPTDSVIYNLTKRS